MFTSVFRLNIFCTVFEGFHANEDILLNLDRIVDIGKFEAIVAYINANPAKI